MDKIDKIDKINNFIGSIDWNKSTNLFLPDPSNNNHTISLIPTIIQDHYGKVLGLVYSSKESLTMAIQQKKGIYFSRKRGLWIKSSSGKNSQKLTDIQLDCDKDSLLFTVVQRGHFCHQPQHYSCFTPTNENASLEIYSEELKIAYCKGHSEQPSMKLLNRLGIKLYRNGLDRNMDLLVKSHLHPNIKILSVRPSDMELIIKKDLADIFLCYDNVNLGINLRNTELRKWMATEPIHKVKVIAFCQKDWKFPTNPSITCPIIIFTEYLDLTKNWLENSYPNLLKDGKVILEKVNGNTEEFVRNGKADIGVAVMDTGKTLMENNLEVLETLSENDMVIYFKNSFYQRNPRLMRQIKNNLENSTIFFYSVDDYGGFMSNFYPCQIYDPETKKEFKSSEHYYQASKFIHFPQIYEEVRNEPTPKQCYKTAYKYQDKFRKDWFIDTDNFDLGYDIKDLKLHSMFNGSLLIKDWVMLKALLMKFSQNQHLRQMLMDSYPKNLVEHSLRDFHYGCGIDGTGKNVLGIMLMDLRNFYLNQYEKAKL